MKLFDLLPAVALTHLWALQIKPVKGSDCCPSGSAAEPGFSSLIRVKTEMSKFSMKHKNWKNVFRKFKSELVRSISVMVNCF